MSDYVGSALPFTLRGRTTVAFRTPSCIAIEVRTPEIRCFRCLALRRSTLRGSGPTASLPIEGDSRPLYGGSMNPCWVAPSTSMSKASLPHGSAFPSSSTVRSGGECAYWLCEARCRPRKPNRTAARRWQRGRCTQASRRQACRKLRSLKTSITESESPRVAVGGPMWARPAPCPP